MSKNNNHKNSSNKLLFIILLTLSFIKLASSICNESNCPKSRGTCSGEYCICHDKYITMNNKNIKNSGIYCNYPLKSRITAFLLELFFPFGIGHFYSGNLLLAIIKLAIFILLFSMCCSLLCCAAGKMLGACSSIISLIVILSLVGLILMEIFDLVGYGFGIYNDGNGVIMS